MITWEAYFHSRFRSWNRAKGAPTWDSILDAFDAWCSVNRRRTIYMTPLETE